MECNFYVGQKIVCVDDDPRGVVDMNIFMVKAGTIYTIDAIAPFVDTANIKRIGVILREHPIVNGGRGYWRHNRFKAVEYKAMGIFRAIAADPTRKLEDA